MTFHGLWFPAFPAGMTDFEQKSSVVPVGNAGTQVPGTAKPPRYEALETWLSHRANHHVRCLEGVEPESFPVNHFDGRAL